MNLNNKFNLLIILAFILDNNIIEIITINQFLYNKNFLSLKLTHMKIFKLNLKIQYQIFNCIYKNDIKMIIEKIKFKTI